MTGDGPRPEHMLFFGHAFLVWFLPFALAGNFLLPVAARNAWMLFVGCVFYATSSLEFLPLLLASTLLDFCAGRAIARSEAPRTRRAWLLGSLGINLGALAFFKYAGLITETLRDVLGTDAIPLIRAPLPVGISFYTFQSMSYTIDVYRRRAEPARSLVDFAAYVTMFPQLIAGPIVRFADIQAQLASRLYESSRFARGLALFVVGMAKKILVADTLAGLARPLFELGDPNFTQAWIGMLLYSGQIYFDFSGYSDMAVGLGRMFGFEFGINFDSPYKSASFSEFWSRWHISLSTWLRDYLYIPLGGNRSGQGKTYRNLAITMLLGGLWHGASWNFLLWGALHGAVLAIERLLVHRRGGAPPWPRWIRVAFVFSVVTMIWVPFRFEHGHETRAWLGAMLLLDGFPEWLRDPARFTSSVEWSQALAAVGLLLAVWSLPNTMRWKFELRPAQTVLIWLLCLATLFVTYGRTSEPPFLYFRF